MPKLEKLGEVVKAATGDGSLEDALRNGQAVDIALDNLPTVSMELNPLETLTLYSRLAPIPENDEAAKEFLLYILALNRPGFLELGAFFSVADDEAILTAAVDVDAIHPASFKEYFDRFANQAGRLREELAEHMETLVDAVGSLDVAPETAPSGAPVQNWISV